jgi:hypothetical protein
LSLDIATIKQCYELQKSNMSVWSWKRNCIILD